MIAPWQILALYSMLFSFGSYACDGTPTPPTVAGQVKNETSAPDGFTREEVRRFGWVIYPTGWHKKDVEEEPRREIYYTPEPLLDGQPFDFGFVIRIYKHVQKSHQLTDAQLVEKLVQDVTENAMVFNEREHRNNDGYSKSFSARNTIDSVTYIEKYIFTTINNKDAVLVLHSRATAAKWEAHANELKGFKMGVGKCFL